MEVAEPPFVSTFCYELQVLIGTALWASIKQCQGATALRPGRAAALRLICVEAVVLTLPILLILTFCFVTATSSRIFKACHAEPLPLKSNPATPTLPPPPPQQPTSNHHRHHHHYYHTTAAAAAITTVTTTITTTTEQSHHDPATPPVKA